MQEETILDLSHQELEEIQPLPPLLREFYCKSNKLTSLPSLPPLLKKLDCNDNNLILLPFPPFLLRKLYCDLNNIKFLPSLPPPPLLEELDVEDNHSLTSLRILNIEGTNLPDWYYRLSIDDIRKSQLECRDRGLPY